MELEGEAVRIELPSRAACESHELQSGDGILFRQALEKGAPPFGKEGDTVEENQGRDAVFSTPEINAEAATVKGLQPAAVTVKP
jgi:hypothetical protein